MPNRVIIDTDPGIDDALALLLALQSPELEIVAVTTVSGNVPVNTATRNIFTVLSLLPSIEKPPMARGASRPLKKDPLFATHFHGDDGLGELHQFRDASGNPRYSPQSITLSERDAVHEKPPNTDVSVNVDASRFLSFFLERVLSLKSS